VGFSQAWFKVTTYICGWKTGRNIVAFNVRMKNWMKWYAMCGWRTGENGMQCAGEELGEMVCNMRVENWRKWYAMCE
jgi:hypothetical protein